MKEEGVARVYVPTPVVPMFVRAEELVLFKENGLPAGVDSLHKGIGHRLGAIGDFEVAPVESWPKGVTLALRLVVGSVDLDGGRSVWGLHASLVRPSSPVKLLLRDMTLDFLASLGWGTATRCSFLNHGPCHFRHLETLDWGQAPPDVEGVMREWAAQLMPPIQEMVPLALQWARMQDAVRRSLDGELPPSPFASTIG